MANKISVLIDVTIDKAVNSLSSFRKAISDADGITNKFKAGATAGFEAVKANAGALALGAGAALIKFGGVVLEQGVQMEALKRKSDTVFGDMVGTVEEWAGKNAAAMGLTKQEAVNAGAAIADLLIPMGFTREEATKQTTSLLDMAGALSAWTGGTRSASEVSQIFTKAMLGEREELKSLGISISEADVQARLAENGTKNLTGAALAQAKAIATQQLIFEKSTDAQTAWSDGTMDGVKAANESKAAMANLKETLVRSLYPALTELAPIVADAVEGITPLVSVLSELSGAAIDTGVSLNLLESDSDKAFANFRKNHKEAFEAAGLDWARYALDVSAGSISIEEALADLEAAQRSQIDITDRAANQAEYYGDVAAETAVVVRGLSKDVRDDADAHNRLASATRDANKALRELNGELSAQEAELDAADGLDKYAAAMADATLSDREKQRATIDVRKELVSYLNTLGDIPPEKQTEILTLIDGGAYELAKTQLDEIARERTVTLSTRVIGGGTGIRQYASGTSSHPGGLAVINDAGPEIVDLPSGTRVYPASLSKQMADGAGGQGTTNNYFDMRGAVGLGLVDFERAVQSALKRVNQRGGTTS